MLSTVTSTTDTFTKVQAGTAGERRVQLDADDEVVQERQREVVEEGGCNR